MSSPRMIVTAALLVRDHTVLLAQRSQDGAEPGAWEFPGGKMEEDESLEACLVRELFEELFIAVDEESCTQVTVVSTERIDLHLFLVEGSYAEPLALSHQALRWVPISDLHTYPMPEADILALPWVTALPCFQRP